MGYALLLAAIVIFACVGLTRLSGRLGIPVLLAFIGLGMFFGSDGVVRIPFENYDMAEKICTFALIFIMFYGGFGTNWTSVRPSFQPAALLSTVGVLLTALLTMLFCRLAFGLSWTISFLTGAVISSTDAASVFSILRSRRLNLRGGTAALLELESGSNDPAAYLLTLIALTLVRGSVSVPGILWLMVKQIVLGLAFGAVIALAAAFVLRRLRMQGGGFDLIFLVGVSVLSWALPTLLDGNGYLSAYVCGLMLGSAKLPSQRELSRAMDGISNFMQMLIFFLLGLLSFPSRLGASLGTAVWIGLFLTLVARPAVVFLLMRPFRMPTKQKALIAFAGLRGASAIVFAILSKTEAGMNNLVFDVTFVIVLLSILIQGGLLPLVARRLDMIDEQEDVMKTFTDYTEEVPVQFIGLEIPASHPWAGKRIKEINMPPDTLAALLERGMRRIVPNGNTCLLPGDRLIISALSPKPVDAVQLSEITVDRRSGHIGQKVSEIGMGEHELIILIKRGSTALIPHGNDRLQEGDILVINRSENQAAHPVEETACDIPVPPAEG